MHGMNSAAAVMLFMLGERPVVYEAPFDLADTKRAQGEKARLKLVEDNVVQDTFKFTI